MPGFDGQVMFCANMDFTDPTSVNFNHPGNFTLPGQIAIGTGNAAPAQQIAVGRITGSGGITITNGSGTINVDGSGVPGTLSFTTDAGTANPAADNINIFGGASGIHTAGAGSTVTLSLSSIPNSSLTNSSITLSNGNNVTVTGSPVSLGGTATINVSGTTQHAVQIGNATNSLTSIAVGTNGQVLIGATTADPAFATLGGTQGVTYTTGANSLSIGLTAVPNSALANSSITLSNGNNISITGSPVSLGGTATVNVAGTTQHAVQIGNSTNSLTSIAIGSTGQVLQANTSADPTWSTATYPSTGGTNGTFLQSNGTNFVNSTALTNGQVWIGNTGNPPTAATLTQGANITITNGAGSITIAASSSSFTPYQKEYLTYTFFGGF